MSQTVQPSVTRKSFTCPHCGALAHQTWFHTMISEYDPDLSPFTGTDENISSILDDPTEPDSVKRAVLEVAAEHRQGKLILNPFEGTPCRPKFRVGNLNLSRCFSCNQVALWVHERTVYPEARRGIAPNADLPSEVVTDFEEARAIFDLSPRGAAALLRLALQKLCAALGEKGKNIDADIASLVQKGLPVQIQQAMDSLRVIGNEAVHPGQIDLNDNREMAEGLFSLLNIIAEVMITQPKHIAEMYSKLPAEKLKAIQNRDKPKSSS